MGCQAKEKTTSTIINPDGSFDFSKEGYKGMDPASHFIINLDMKDVPFPGQECGALRIKIMKLSQVILRAD